MRHRIYRRVVISLCVVLALVWIFRGMPQGHEKEEKAETEETEEEALTLWYTDERLNAYLVEAADRKSVV